MRSCSSARTGRPACRAARTTAAIPTAHARDAIAGRIAATRRHRRTGRLGDDRPAAGRSDRRRRRFHLETSRADRRRRCHRRDRARSTRRGSRRPPRRSSPRIAAAPRPRLSEPVALPPGGVLVVGSGQTGVQLAEELHEAGRAGDAVGRPLRSRAAALPRPRLLLVAPRAGRARAGARHAAADGRHAAGPAAAVRVQPAHVGARRRARHEPAAIRGRRDPPGRPVRRRRRRARHGSRQDLAANLRFADDFFDERFRPLFETLRASRAGDRR